MHRQKAQTFFNIFPLKLNPQCQDLFRSGQCQADSPLSGLFALGETFFEPSLPMDAKKHFYHSRAAQGQAGMPTGTRTRIGTRTARMGCGRRRDNRAHVVIDHLADLYGRREHEEEQRKQRALRVSCARAAQVTHRGNAMRHRPDSGAARTARAACTALRLRVRKGKGVSTIFLHCMKASIPALKRARPMARSGSPTSSPPLRMRSCAHGSFQVSTVCSG